MIQVLKRAFQVIEQLNPAEGTTLADLSRSLGINKGTLCNILKTLINLGYVAKTRNGHYIIHPDFYTLALPYSSKNLLHRIAKKYSDMLAEGTKESGVVATLRNHRMHIMAQSQFQRSLMLNTEFYDNLSLYHSVSGRIIIAYLSDERARQLIAVHGYPGSEWNNINNPQKFQTALADIRREGIAVMPNQREGIKAFAVPVFDALKNICASIGITVPSFRLEEDNEKVIVDVLKNTSELLTQANIENNLTQTDWFEEKSGP